ncbi:MAG: M20/M25/M40 family metallo-hydrolase [Alphaproteobacteria bacterium]|nr:M20/M25/M40 family metallo-hydrolase [Alphaproteobacteria bacterium]
MTQNSRLHARLHEPQLDRRLLLQGAAASVLIFRPGAAFAQSGDYEAIRSAAQAGKEASIKRIQDWIARPTIAAENRDIELGCNYMMGLAKEAGFQHVERIPTDGAPGVFATLDVGAPRWMGVYFMYDVKQYDPSEWSSPPLEGRLVDKPGFGKVIVGRGAVNQKGPEATFLAALHAIRAAGKKPPVNLALVCEGEEEIGSPHFRQIVQHPHVLPALKKCLGIIIPAGWQNPNGSVQINLGAKGIIEVQLISSGERWGRGPTHDIHSSQKAHVDSPAWRLVEALQTLVSPDGNTPAIEGWFENVRPLTAREKELIAQTAAPTSEAEAKAAFGVKHWINDEPWETSLERLVSQPTVNIEGLVSGYTGPGGKTILPARAEAKLDFRLVPNMTAEEALSKLKAHLKKKGFGDIEAIMSGGYDPTSTPENSRVIRAQQAVYDRAGVVNTLFPRSPGSWPGCVFTSAPLSLPAGQFGLGHGSGAHAPDEYYVIDSTNPKVAGLIDATMGYVDYLYEVATIS